VSSVGLAVALLIASEIGLIVIDQHPAGLDARYGWLILALSLFTFVPLLLGWPDKRERWGSILLIAALLGCGRALLIHPPITDRDLAYYNAAPDSPRVFVTGSISGEPAYTDRSQRLRVSARTIQLAPSPPKEVSGDMYVVLPRYPTFDIGERLVLSGTLTAPPRFEGFDYPAYLARHGIFSYMTFPRVRNLGAGDATGPQRLLVDARSRVREALRRNIAEPQAALVVGVVTGDRTSIPRDVQEAFLRSGTTHILAISGQNISLLVGAVWLFYGAATRRRRMSMPVLLLVLLMLAAYTAFTGATPAVVRAALMGSVLLAAPLVLRRYDPIAALSLSAAVMVFSDPDVLADAGFQLSFAAMLGISLLGPRIYRRMKQWRIPAIVSLPIATDSPRRQPRPRLRPSPPATSRSFQCPPP
jgi:competence protein ComEC